MDKGKLADEIQGLIENEPDAQTRAILLVLYKISQTLSDTTELTKTLVEEVELQGKQLTANAQYLAEQQGVARGTRRVLMPVLTVLQAIVFAVTGVLYSSQVDIAHKLTEIEKTVVQLEAKLTSAKR